MSLVTPRKGYKSVPWLFGKEIEIPDEWEVKSVNCLGEIVTGTTPSTIVKEYYGDEFLWATPSDLISIKNIVETETKLSKKGFEQVRKLPKHSIMMTCIGMIGRTGLTSEEMSTNQQINSIIIKNVNFEYVYYSLTYNQKRISNSANQSVVQIINKKDFGKIIIIIPKNILEQQKIATILSNVDNLIESTEKVITHSKKVKTGLMQKLLTRGIGHVTFKKVPWLFGKEIEIPEEWEIKQLRNCIKNNTVITYGIVQAGSNLKSGISYFRTLDLTKNILNFKELWKTSEEISNQYKRTILQEGDLIVTVRASVGDLKIITKDFEGCNLSRGVAKISPSNEVDVKFLLEELNGDLMQKQFSFLTNGTTFRDITMDNLRKLKIFVPSLSEQQKIATILSNMDSKITSQEQYKEKLQLLKKSLMQKLLTGEVRV